MRTLMCATAGMISLVSLTGCVAWTGPGPMNLDDHGGGYCAPTSVYSEMAVAIGLGDPSDADITIESVRAGHEDGVDLIAAWLVPVTEDRHIGFLEFPPDEEFADTWEASILAENAVIPAGEIWELVLQVRSGDPTGGTLSGITVRYAQNGFVHETHPKLEVEFAQGDCD